MTVYDGDRDGGLFSPERHRSHGRPKASDPTRGAIIVPFEGWVFAQGPPADPRPLVGQPAGNGHRYTRPGLPLDLHAFIAPDDPLVAWIRDRGAQVTDLTDRARVMRNAKRRVVSAQATDLLVVDARHPRILEAARVTRADLKADDPRARHRIATVARNIPGVGALRVAPTPGGEADGMVILANYVSEHVTFVHSKVQPVEPLVMRALRGDRPAVNSAGATIVDLDAARRQRERMAEVAASNSQAERTD